MFVVERRVYERIRERLRRLYGEEALPRLMDRLQLIIGRYGVGADCPPEASGCAPWDQTDVVLIAYGDMVCANHEAPLATLRRFLEQHVGDAISSLHLLPFFPSSSDDGFAITDYRQVDPALGSWADVDALAEDYRLMLDLVVNHVSSQSRWFRAYTNGMAPERHYFIEVDPKVDLSKVVRPRTSALLRSVQTPQGERHVWATFGHDQIDVDFSNPDVLFEYLDIVLFYVHHGAQIIRLDAIAYLWKQLGSACIHLPQTHEVVKLLRDLLTLVAPTVLLMTETNVPHTENISYFGNGDEAHLVYQFSLPPLLLHAMHSGNGRYLTEWAAALAPPPPGCTYFNFTASHDGIGVRPLEGLLPQSQLDGLVAAMEERGGLISRRSNPDGSATPYELNITYFDAVGIPGDLEASIRRFLCVQTIAMSLQGLPGIYFNSLLGASNNLRGAEQSGRARTINRQKWALPELEVMLSEGSSHQAQRLLPEYLRRLRIRRSQAAFHPEGPQRVLELPAGLFGVCRVAPDNSQTLWMIANLTGAPVQLGFARLVRRPRVLQWTELIGGWHQSGEQLPSRFELEPYQVAWLVGR
ncbi:sugar phosphorylase [Lamprobacter modestohalophilus]|uniref:sugar phosphorylase n=1 Tax=Lamprobacter modestohalophilus TaxID=1064514 RepID=UPI002ADEB574|nr:sugar phosphorylase [Lamprobacter modestohalophilus]MEA1052504.1 sugar phosphorylase [Lamprobacter modestohalophilus]